MNGYVATIGAILLIAALLLTLYEALPRVVAWISALVAVCTIVAVPAWHLDLIHSTSAGTGIAVLGFAGFFAAICFYLEGCHGHRTHPVRAPAFGALFGASQLLVINQAGHFAATVWAALGHTAKSVASRPGNPAATTTAIQPLLLLIGLGVVGVIVGAVCAHRLGMLPTPRRRRKAPGPPAVTAAPGARSRSGARRAPNKGTPGGWPT